jgi:hypothetical protein
MDDESVSIHDWECDRFRWKLWKDTFLQYSSRGDLDAGVALDAANDALLEFDTHFLEAE